MYEVHDHLSDSTPPAASAPGVTPDDVITSAAPEVGAASTLETDGDPVSGATPDHGPTIVPIVSPPPVPAAVLPMTITGLDAAAQLEALTTATRLLASTTIRLSAVCDRIWQGIEAQTELLARGTAGTAPRKRRKRRTVKAPAKAPAKAPRAPRATRTTGATRRRRAR